VIIAASYNDLIPSLGSVIICLALLVFKYASTLLSLVFDSVLGFDEDPL